MAGCTYDYHQAGNGSKEESCPHELWNDSEYCIFHSPNLSLKPRIEDQLQLVHPKGGIIDWRGFILPELNLDKVQNISGNYYEKIDARNIKLHGEFYVHQPSNREIDLSHATIWGDTHVSYNADCIFLFNGTLFKRSTNFQNSNFCESYFDGASFERQLILTQADLSRASFKGCHFLGPTKLDALTFREAQFANATFKKRAFFLGNCMDADFSSCTFQQGAVFSGLHLEKSTFQMATFRKSTSFCGCKLAETSFIGCSFEEKVDFSDSKIEKNLPAKKKKEPWGTETEPEPGKDPSKEENEPSYWEQTRFMKNSDFSRVVFRNVQLSQAVFYGPVSFQNATLSDCSFASSKFLSTTDFSQALIKQTSFQNAYFRGKTHFSFGPLEALDFTQVDFGPLTFEQVSSVTVQSEESQKQEYTEICFHKARFRKGSPVWFDRCDLGDVDFSFSTFHDVIIFEGSTFYGDTNFSGTQFKRYINGAKSTWFRTFDLSGKVLPGAYFNEACFKQSADFSNAKLKAANFSRTSFEPDINSNEIGANFKGACLYEARFDHATFSGTADFSEARFFGKEDHNQLASFKQTTFQDVDFNQSTFDCQAKFHASKALEATFLSANFIQAIVFKMAQYNLSDFSNATFRSANFDQFKCKRGEFKDTLFRGTSQFIESVFDEYVNFQQAMFKGTASFHLMKAKTSDFSVTRFEKSCLQREARLGVLKFSNVIVGGSLDFSGAEAVNPNFNALEVHGSASYQKFQCSGEEVIFTGSHFFEELDFNEAKLFLEDSNPGRLDFSQVQFDGTTNFKDFNCKGDFYAPFLIVKQPFVWLGNLDGDFTFEQAHFSSNFQFLGYTFKGKINLNQTQFDGEVNFSKSVFKELSLCATHFGGKSIFKGCTFSEKTIIKQLLFIGEATFSDSEFKEDLVMEGLHFKGGLTFEHVILNRPLLATGWHTDKLSYKTHRGKVGILFNQLEILGEQGESSFCDQDCSELAFVNSNLNRALFLGADIRDTRFDSCRWDSSNQPHKYPRLSGHQKVIEEVDQPGGEAKLELLQSLYLQLIKRYEDERDYQQAGAFHYWEMELRLLRQKRMIQNTSSQFTKSALRLENLLLKLYRGLGGHGENYLKLLGYFLGWQLLIGFLVMGTQSGTGQDVANWIKGGLVGPGEGFWSAIGQFAGDWALDTQRAFSTVLPAGITKNKLFEGLRYTSRLILTFGAVGSFTLFALFVLSIRRRFRR